MKGNQHTIASALKETVKLFCQSWIEYQNVLVLDGDLKIKYDEGDAIIIRFDEKLYGHCDSGNVASSTNPAAVSSKHSDVPYLNSTSEPNVIETAVTEDVPVNNDADVLVKVESSDDVIVIEEFPKVKRRKRGRPRKQDSAATARAATIKTLPVRHSSKPKCPKLTIKLKRKGTCRNHKQVCELCRKQFSTNSLLIRHLQTHGDECQYSCNECKLRFLDDAMLQEHAKKHANDSSSAIINDKEYQCNVCFKTFSRQNALAKHAKEHSSHATDNSTAAELPQGLSCDICGVQHSSQEQLTEHMLDQHANNDDSEVATLKCTLCGQSFATRNMLNRHVKRHAKHRKQHARREPIHECVECRKKFTTQYRLSKHVSVFHKLPGIEDVDLSNGAATVATSNEVQKGAGEVHECWVCHKTLRTVICLKNHMKLHTDDKAELHCDKCGRKCLGLAALEKHKRLHGQEGATLTCTICGKWFSHESLMKVHVDNHNKQLPCELCGQVFNGKRAFKAHQLVHRDMLMHVCEVCGERFRSSEVLSIHAQTHNLLPGQSAQLVMAEGRKALAEKKSLKGRHACDKCGKRFAAVYHLQIHMNCHTGERPFKCDQCDKTYRTNSALRSHKLSHTGIRPYECQTCQKRFKSKSDLNQHMKSHSSDTPYECQVCGSKFAYRWSWQQHERGHLGLKPFLCNVCGKSFTQACTLRGHQKIHERDDTKLLTGNGQDSAGGGVAAVSASLAANNVDGTRRKKHATKAKKSALPPSLPLPSVVPSLAPDSAVMVVPSLVDRQLQQQDITVTSTHMTMEPLTLPLLANRGNNLMHSAPPYTYQTMTQAAHALLPPIEYASMIPHHMAEQYHHLSLPDPHLYTDYSRNRFGHPYE